MKFEIDVSGEDLLNVGYTICVANKDHIKGFKMNRRFVDALHSRYNQRIYRYHESKKGRSSLKVRLYCCLIYFILKSLHLKGGQQISLLLCKDFDGNEEKIKDNLNHFLGTLLGLNIQNINFARLDRSSNAHRYAYLMRNDTENKLITYVKIELNEVEQFIKKN